MIFKRWFMSGVLAAAAVCTFAAPAPAQTYPVKPVRIIVPFAPGGVDVTARLIADRLTAALGQPFIVENRPGAGGSVGAKMVASSEPDGHTLMFSTPGPVVVSPLINRNAGYDTLKSFAPVAIVSQSPLLLVVHPSVPAKTVQGTRGLRQGQSRQGALPLARLRHAAASGRRDVQVADRHSTSCMFPIAVRRPRSPICWPGRCRSISTTSPTCSSTSRAASCARIAVTGDARVRATAGRADHGTRAAIGGIAATYWNGMLAPAGTPPAIVARLNAAVNQALAVPEVRAALHEARFRSQDAELRRNSPPSSRRKSQRWGKVVRDANIKVE